MALNKALLKADLITWMNTPRTDKTVAGQAFEDAYYNYIAGSTSYAEDVSGDKVNSVITNSIKNVFVNLTLNETYTTAAEKIEAGFIAYWTEATFKILLPATGISAETSATVTTPPATGSLSTTLTSIFSNLNTTVDNRAEALANAIDTMTQTIVVTCVGPSTVSPYTPISVPGTIT
jgi:hypothetical protein